MDFIFGFFHRVGQLLYAIPFSGATWFIIGTLGFCIWLFSKAHKNEKSLVDWEHLVVDSQNDRASPYKVGYLIGVIVATWIVLTFADKDKLNYDIFGMYLTYLLGGAGWNAFMKGKGIEAHVTDKSRDDEDPPPKP